MNKCNSRHTQIQKEKRKKKKGIEISRHYKHTFQCSSSSAHLKQIIASVQDPRMALISELCDLTQKQTAWDHHFSSSLGGLSSLFFSWGSDWLCIDASKSLTEGSFGSTPGSDARMDDTKDWSANNLLMSVC